MKITIPAVHDSAHEDQSLVLTNDDFNNLVFVDILTEEKAYTVNIFDLKVAVDAFMTVHDDYKKEIS